MSVEDGKDVEPISCRSEIAKKAKQNPIPKVHFT